MATEQDVDEKWIEARLALLSKIPHSVGNPGGALKLAEAYAWLTYPNNSHGGTAGTS